MMYSYWLHWCGHCNSLFFLHNSPQPVKKQSRTTVNHFIIKSQNTIKLTAKRQRSVDHHIFFQGNQKGWTNLNPLQLLKNTWISQPFKSRCKYPLKSVCIEIAEFRLVLIISLTSVQPQKNQKLHIGHLLGMFNDHLKLTDKTEFLTTGTQQQQPEKVHITSICVVTQTIIPFLLQRISVLGLTQGYPCLNTDKDLWFIILSICTTYYASGNISHKSQLKDSYAFISRWLDYCNSLLYSLPYCSLNKLQHV